MRVIVELDVDPFSADDQAEAYVTMARSGVRAGAATVLQVDQSFGVVPIVHTPRVARTETRMMATAAAGVSDEDDDLTFDTLAEEGFAPRPETRAPGDPSEAQTRVLIRGEIPTEDAAETARRLPGLDGRVRRVFSDPLVERCALCRNDSEGTAATVAAALETGLLEERGMTGNGVRVAVVDGGFNVRYLKDHLRANPLDAANSVEFSGAPKPGKQVPDHGTMCAFEVGIAAAQAALIDVPMLQGKALKSLLSDGIRAYAALREALINGLIDGPLVVTNSWAIFDPGTDFDPDHESNYTHTLDHPFNIAVESLVDAGADVLFAAGNCGATCRYPGCRFKAGTDTITGANAHPDVLCVGGVGVDGSVVGYSPIGGTLVHDKPDTLAYTQFDGSGVDGIDGGTSTACPLAAGVVAAIRTVFPTSVVDPRTLIQLVRATSRGVSSPGEAWSPGTIDTKSLLDALPA